MPKKTILYKNLLADFQFQALSCNSPSPTTPRHSLSSTFSKGITFETATEKKSALFYDYPCQAIAVSQDTLQLIT